MQTIYNRSSKENAPTVLILGGHGFIGRYTAQELNKFNANVIIGTRGHGELAEHERQVKLHQTLTVAQWIKVLNNVDVVINTVGILRERKDESFETVHHLSVSALARTCQKHDIPLIHMSALGLSADIKDEFIASKLHGENSIKKANCRGAIVRASIVNAPDGYGAGWMYKVARWPIWLLPRGATKTLCPIEATDLGEVLATLAVQTFQQGNQNKLSTYEVACKEKLDLERYLLRLRTQQAISPKKPWLCIRIPQVITKFFARIFDVLHLTPYSNGHHELLQNDNAPINNHVMKILGRKPKEIGNPPFIQADDTVKVGKYTLFLKQLRGGLK